MENTTIPASREPVSAMLANLLPDLRLLESMNFIRIYDKYEISGPGFDKKAFSKALMKNQFLPGSRSTDYPATDIDYWFSRYYLCRIGIAGGILCVAYYSSVTELCDHLGEAASRIYHLERIKVRTEKLAPLLPVLLNTLLPQSEYDQRAELHRFAEQQAAEEIGHSRKMTPEQVIQQVSTSPEMLVEFTKTLKWYADYLQVILG